MTIWAFTTEKAARDYARTLNDQCVVITYQNGIFTVQCGHELIYSGKGRNA